MKQILQDLKSGETRVDDIPCPIISTGSVLIQTSKTLISAGTERMLVEFGKGDLLKKARQQPDKVRMVLDKVKTDGVLPTLEAVRSKLDTPLPLGYCNVGTVLESHTDAFRPGDRVVSNGKHAEVVAVPKHLCARIPDSVDNDSAAFTVIGAIALQGIRLTQPTLGESVVVTGLGLIGLMAVQLLRAHGCRVLGIDYDPAKLVLAKQFGADVVDLSLGQDPVAAAGEFSRGRGIDAVLITASTKSNEPIHQAATMCRKRGRIVLVGVVGMSMSRADFYEKELTFQVSCSYGPGRYDENYEEKSQDYPVAYVRWTEQRNFEAVLDMMADGRLDMKPLVSHRFKLDQAADAYEVISSGNPLGIILEFNTVEDIKLLNKTVQLNIPSGATGSCAVVGFIGAGNYAASKLVPAFNSAGARLKAISSATGVSSIHVGKKNGIETATTDSDGLLADPEINTLVITTRHNSHAKWVQSGLLAGKHVFVEKPLTLTRNELHEVVKKYTALPTKPLLMVGFNRRYAPHIQQMKRALSVYKQPKSMIMTANVGAIPADHWTQDPEVGGGRIIGECCHFIDLLRYLADSPIESVNAVAMNSECKDSVIINLKFQDGSIGSVNYLANGSKSFSKERLEIFCGGSILQLDNFRRLKAFGWPGIKNDRVWRQNKGQENCVKAFINAIESGDGSDLIPITELIEVAEACFDVIELIS